jgi:hypothetical protein
MIFVLTKNKRISCIMKIIANTLSIVVLVITTAASAKELRGGRSEQGQQHRARHLLGGDGFTGCLEVDSGKTTPGAKLILGDCSNYNYGFDDQDARNGLKRFVSRLDTSMCMQAQGTLQDGTPLRLYPCRNNNRKQLFTRRYGTSISLRPVDNTSLCVSYQGNTAETGDRIKLKSCDIDTSGWMND